MSLRRSKTQAFRAGWTREQINVAAYARQALADLTLGRIDSVLPENERITQQGVWGRQELGGKENIVDISSRNCGDGPGSHGNVQELHAGGCGVDRPCSGRFGDVSLLACRQDEAAGVKVQGIKGTCNKE